MDVLTTIMTILSYVLVIIGICLVLIIYISLFWSKFIIKKISDKIREKRKEVLKIQLQDQSLFIQLSAGIGISFILFSLSLKGAMALSFFLIGLSATTISVILLFWKYLPLRNKMYKYYTSKKRDKK